MLNNISNVEDEIRNSIDYINSTNSTLSDSLKIINTEDPKQPSLQNLINEIIYPV